MRLLALLVALIAGLFAIPQTATAQAPVRIITVDENGNGTIAVPGDGSFAIPSALAHDFGPGGLPSALTYNFLNVQFVAGDVILLEPATGVGLISDLIRFNAAGVPVGSPANLVFYSDNVDGTDALADTGFPTALYANNITFTELGLEGTGTDGFLYTPTPGQPGFISGFAITYDIRSDNFATVPEPASLALLGTALVGFGVIRRTHGSRRRNNSPAGRPRDGARRDCGDRAGDGRGAVTI